MLPNHVIGVRYLVRNLTENIKFKSNKIACSVCRKRRILTPYHRDYLKLIDVEWVCEECFKTLDEPSNTKLTVVEPAEYLELKEKMNAIENKARFNLLPLVRETCCICHKTATKVFVYDLKLEEYYYVCKEHNDLLKGLFGVCGHIERGNET